MKKILTIAGSDCSGGAGIQADLKTITMHGMYGMSVITSLTAQNTMGVYGIVDTPKEMIEKQLDAIFTDIMPDAVKIGMVSNSECIEVIARKLEQYAAKHIVVDPVMVATSGSRLMQEEAIECLQQRLFPLATVITPNIPEAEVLSNRKIRTEEEMERAAEQIASKYGCGVLIKGGHSVHDASDYLYDKNVKRWFYGKRVVTSNTHGTGCTLSSAIACALTAGNTLEASVQQAKTYLTEALQDGLDLGKGSGPLNHMYRMKMKKE